MSQYKQNKGFTIIELILAMTFVSFLLLAIAMTVIQISNTYNKGVVIKETNQAAISITKQMKDTVSSSSSFNIKSQYIKQNWGGRLCTGKYTFVWNYGGPLNSGGTNLNRYSGSAKNDISFVKVVDTNSSYCSNPSLAINPDSSVELLDVGQNKILAVHNFDIVALEDKLTGQTLYDISILVGTNETQALTGAGSGVSCKPPNVQGANPVYCSVTNFNITARAGVGIN